MYVSDTNKYNTSSSANGTVIESSLIIVNLQSSNVGTYTYYAESIIGDSAVLAINGNNMC